MAGGADAGVVDPEALDALASAFHHHPLRLLARLHGLEVDAVGGHAGADVHDDDEDVIERIHALLHCAGKAEIRVTQALCCTGEMPPVYNHKSHTSSRDENLSG